MKVVSYTQARQQFSSLLNTAKKEEVIIKRRGGDSFKLAYVKQKTSPLDIPGIKTSATTKDIVSAIRESRER